MYYNEKGYQGLINDVLFNGYPRPDRTGTGTKTVFSRQLTLQNVGKQFPLFTCRKIYTKGVIGELCGFLRGATSTQELESWGCHYWAAWAFDRDEDNLGPIYGSQWRDFDGQGYDQIAELIWGLKHEPFSRRHLVSCWNPNEINEMALPPCFDSFQCHVAEGTLHMTVRMRSSDIIIGLPSDIVFHALLLILLAQEVGLKAGDLTFQLGDTHIYSNHLEQAELLAVRKLHPYATVTVDQTRTVCVHPAHVHIENYIHNDPMKLELAV